MFPAQHEAKQKFWQIPEMIGHLLTFLDLGSTLCLAQSHKKTRKVLQDIVVWNKLVKRSSPLNQQEKVEHLVAILKLMKDPKPKLPVVLHAICETNPPTRPGFFQMGFVKLSCPLHLRPHSVSLAGFELLEKVEKAFETRVQSVESVSLGVSSSSVLASRLSRQQQRVASLSIDVIKISSKKEAEDFKTWMLALQPRVVHLKLRLVDLQGPIGSEGWESVATVLRAHPGLLTYAKANEDAFNGGRVEDVRVFWDAICPIGYLRVFRNDGPNAWGRGEIFLRMAGEAAWTRLCHILDLSTGVVEDGQSNEGGEEGGVDEDGEEEEEVEEQGAEEEGYHGEDA